MTFNCKTKKNPKFNIGTSGFMISQNKWSKLPCLNCIEINSSFYRIPTDKMIDNLLKLPDNISYVIKASRYITHMKRLKDVQEAWDKLWDQISKLSNRLNCVLFQLPPSFVKNDINVKRINMMKSYLPNNLQYAFEFRNKSWLNDDTYKQFKKLNWCIVGTFIIKKDTEKWVGNMPPGLYLPPKTTNYNYIRIHGKKGWKGSLTQKQLDTIKNKLNSQKTNTSYVMFNNTFFDNRKKTCKANNLKINYAAVCNAITFSNI